MSLGSVGQQVSVRYFQFPGVRHGGAAQPPNIIWLDKARSWDRREAQCLIAHEYGHLAGRRHSKGGIMQPTVPYDACKRWLRRHGVR